MAHSLVDVRIWFAPVQVSYKNIHIIVHAHTYTHDRSFVFQLILFALAIILFLLLHVVRLCGLVGVRIPVANQDHGCMAATTTHMHRQAHTNGFFL